MFDSKFIEKDIAYMAGLHTCFRADVLSELNIENNLLLKALRTHRITHPDYSEHAG